MKKTPKIALTAILLFSLMFCIVSAFTVTVGVNFVGDGGGNVTFIQNFLASRLTWINGLNRFANFRWGGNNFGNVGFDADAGTNMTILSVTREEINYNISNPGVPLSTQRVFYGDKGVPTIVGGVITNFNDATNIVTITTLGDADVTLTWRLISTQLTEVGIILVGIFLIIALILIFMALGGQINTKELITFLVVITIVMAFAAIFRQWGF